MKRLFTILFLFFISVLSFGQEPKYIIFFIGDGMGESQIALAGEAPVFTTFPVQGMQTTHSASDAITDSAAAGTALATATKTANGTIAMNPEHSTHLYSMMVLAKLRGWGTGVMSSVSVDHATPAAFYAHAESREQYGEISSWVTRTGLDFYAGGGFRDPGENLEGFQNAGYLLVRGEKPEFTEQRIVWIQDSMQNQYQLPYAVERKEGDMTLPHIVESALEFFEGRDQKFIIMAEGGLIDWACHDNDAVRAKGEVEDLDEAVKVALEFYEQHHAETLIVVTADHETGGLSLDKKGRPRWTTTGHSAADVPVFAIGVGAENFRGSYDNTELSRKIMNLIN